jgi:hypothetical protein
MDADEARFQLLLKEMDSIQQGIQAMDNSMFKIKGWSITLAAAAAGLAANERHPLIAAIGMVTAVASGFLKGTISRYSAPISSGTSSSKEPSGVQTTHWQSYGMITPITLKCPAWQAAF